ncbi:MAG: CHAD domain-containing protein [Nitrospira sp.]|nr:CHAD domain-containing protein [Nitrospira sp.]
MIRAEPSIHIAQTFHSQDVAQAALTYQSTILQLVVRLMEDEQSPEILHALRTHCRRLQAILQLCGEARDARVLARGVQRLSKLRASHVFKQYLLTIDASQADVALADARIHKQIQKAREAAAYDALAHVVMAHAVPPTLSGAALLDRLESVRQEHHRRLQRLIEKARDSPTRKRLHALRLRLKTIRYQCECIAPQAGSTHDLLRKMIRLQGLLGRYEELSDFRRWGTQLSETVQKQIRNDWKKARKRARAIPGRLAWLLRALGSRDARLSFGQ